MASPNCHVYVPAYVLGPRQTHRETRRERIIKTDKWWQTSDYPCTMTYFNTLSSFCNAIVSVNLIKFLVQSLNQSHFALDIWLDGAPDIHFARVHIQFDTKGPTRRLSNQLSSCCFSFFSCCCWMPGDVLMDNIIRRLRLPPPTRWYQSVAIPDGWRRALRSGFIAACRWEHTQHQPNATAGGNSSAYCINCLLSIRRRCLGDTCLRESVSGDLCVLSRQHLLTKNLVLNVLMNLNITSADQRLIYGFLVALTGWLILLSHSFIHSLAHILTHLLTHSPTHSSINSLIWLIKLSNSTRLSKDHTRVNF